jgi:threonyl-tRNA synthetase
VDKPELWRKTEAMVRTAMEKTHCPFVEVPNEAAFYGPKIDVNIWSAIGREFTLATNQVDFDIPGRVGLKYVDRDGAERTPLCIHRAPLGTHERLIGFLIEHFAGHFPLWLAPVQAVIIPVAEPHEVPARRVLDALRGEGMRTELSPSTESLSKRIREGETQRVPYLLVIGDKEVKENAVAVRNVRTKEQVVVPLKRFLEETKEDIRLRRLACSIG